MTYAKPQRSTMKAAAKHLSTKVVGSVSLFKEEQAKHAAAEAEKKRQAEEQARQLLEQARQLAAAVDKFKNSSTDPGQIALGKCGENALADFMAELAAAPAFPLGTKLKRYAKTPRATIPVPDEG